MPVGLSIKSRIKEQEHYKPYVALQGCLNQENIIEIQFIVLF
jgi:hypothetical protein